MRVLFLNQFYPPDLAPTGRVLSELAQPLAQAGHEVTVLTSRASYEGGQSRPPRERDKNVWLVEVPTTGFGRRNAVGKLIDYAGFYLGTVWKLRKMPSYDLVVAMTSPPFLGLLARGATRRWKTQHAHWIMDLYPDALFAHHMIREKGWLGRVLKWLNRRSWQGASTILALGPDMAQRCQAYAANPDIIHWVPLWHSAHLASETADNLEAAAKKLRNERGWNDGRLTLLYSGNLGLGHHLDTFRDAAERLGPSGPRWAFYGGGRRYDEWETFCREHPDLPVSMAPYVAHEALPAHLASADVLLASLRPGWEGVMVPSKLADCFSAGRPVIFVGPSECAISSWIHQSGAGWQVQPGDGDALCKAVEEARNESLRHKMGEKARLFAREHFDREKNTRKLVTLLEEATGKGR